MEKFTRNNRWRREGIIVERGQKWGSRHSAAFNLKLLKTSFKHGCRFTSTNDKPFLSFDFIYILFLLLLFHFFFFIIRIYPDLNESNFHANWTKEIRNGKLRW